jgi:Xaa-Pro dipeptidase
MPKSAAVAPFERAQLPRKLCNVDRLIQAMQQRGLDGIVATQPLNVFYLATFNGIAHKADEPRPYAVLLSRRAPDRPVMVVADYYLATLIGQPSWIEDVRPYRSLMMPMDLPARRTDFDRFVPKHGAGLAWIDRAREAYQFDMSSALRGALKDLGLDRGRVGFDDMGVGLRLKLEGLEVADGYDPLMYARAVKTPEEMKLLERATRLNEEAIRRTVAAWDKGCTWRQLNRAYSLAVAELGGFVHDPGGMVWGHPRGADPAIMLQTGLEDHAVEEGTHVLFDCHGTIDLYCWDGGKTWVVGGQPSAETRRRAAAMAAACETLLGAMKPGAKVSELQAKARAAFRKAGADADSAAIFFHGLGLSHMELEQTLADGRPNGDWALQAGMVVPMHLLLPGGESERFWLEEVAAVGPDGGRPLFSWGPDPLTGG